MTAENEVISGISEAKEAQIDMRSYQDPVKASPECNGTKLKSVNLIGNDNVSHDPHGLGVVDGDVSNSDKNVNGELVFVQASLQDETGCVLVSAEKGDLNGTQVELALSMEPKSEEPVIDSRNKNDTDSQGQKVVELALAASVEPNSEEAVLDSRNKNDADVVNNGEIELESDSKELKLDSISKNVADSHGELGEIEPDSDSKELELDSISKNVANSHGELGEIEPDSDSKELELDSISKNVADSHGELGEIEPDSDSKELELDSISKNVADSHGELGEIEPDSDSKELELDSISKNVSDSHGELREIEPISVDPDSKELELDSISKNVADSHGGLVNNGEIDHSSVVDNHPSVFLSAEKDDGSLCGTINGEDDGSLCGTINGEVDGLEIDKEAKYLNQNGTEAQENGQFHCRIEVKDEPGLKLASETCDKDPNFNRNSSPDSYSKNEKSVVQFATCDTVKHLDETTDRNREVGIDTDIAIDSLDTEVTEVVRDSLDTEVTEVVSEDSHDSACDPDSRTLGIGESDESFQLLMSVALVPQKNLDSESREEVTAYESGSGIQGVDESEKSFQPSMSQLIPQKNLASESTEDVHVTVQLTNEDMKIENFCKKEEENNTISVGDSVGDDCTVNNKEGPVGVRDDSGGVHARSSDLVDCAITDPNIICGTLSSVTGIEFGSFRPLEVPLEQNLKKKIDHSVKAQVAQDHVVPVSKRFQYLIKIPRFDDERLQNELRDVKLLLDEKTHERDGVQIEVKLKRNNFQVLYKKFREAQSEERAARELVKLKRKEIDSIQAVNNRLNNVISLAKIDREIFNAEKTIQHQSLKSLKDEKDLVHKIKQLKFKRHELSSNIDSKDDVRQVLDQIDHTDELLKSLKKELFGLKDKVSKAEEAVTSLKLEYDDEGNKLKELDARLKNANYSRDGVYKHFSALKKEFWEKSKYFGRYKNDANAANDFAFTGDKEALYKLCINQVDTIMELWNSNAEFRKDYVRCNMRSTLRRLKTLDGRSLGPDEEAIVFPTVRVGKQISNVATASSLVSSIDQPKVVLAGSDSRSLEVEQKQKHQSLKSSCETTATPIVIDGPEIEVEKSDDDRQSEQELEMARKAEALRKKEMDEKIKEQRRLEEKAKAQQALERKRRNAEKAQRRAEIRAQKEAEEKEKIREKRQRRNERKKSIVVGAERGSTNGDEIDTPLELPAETGKEDESKETSTNAFKKSQKTYVTKQTKVVPPPLRNKGKRKWKQTIVWTMWISVVIVIMFIILGGEEGVFGGGRSQRSENSSRM